MSESAFSRRTVGKMLLALPAAVLPVGEPREEKPSEQAEFIAAHEGGLTAEERERLKKSIADVEKPLAVIRDFKLPMDVAPSLRFRALKSNRG